MADEKDSLRKLRDLAELKERLRGLQQQLEESGGAAAAGGSVLSSPLLKGFALGFVFARLRVAGLAGALVGVVAGAYAAQSYELPDVGLTLASYLRRVRGDDGGPRE
ncbi:SLC35A4 upstream microprotein isoform X2 [Petromyzon marinus]|uniref:SLC35A4 upstream open reading frame protein-like isoform X2 n=1 Tax=Petromyzon marinus TaxID=7757 RepID=A0AAJ7ULB8_PETMA|nr:SLC35A4 upstream open reading frame protein-like isoform X2 [Petromyzon marinus]